MPTLALPDPDARPDDDGIQAAMINAADLGHAGDMPSAKIEAGSLRGKSNFRFAVIGK